MAEREALQSANRKPLQASLSRDAYLSPTFFERERQAIFHTQWFYCGREERLAQAGAFMVLDILGESVVVVRSQAGGLHAHLNVCRHRGSRLLCGSGSLRASIRCPYHGWTYAFDGRLIASPFIEPGDVPSDARRLYAAEVDCWGGFVFVRVTRSEGTPATLTGQLGEVPNRLRRYPLSALRIAHSVEYHVRANWKVLLENYNECYHCAGVHPELCRIVPDFKKHGGADLDWERGIAHRQDAWTFTATGSSDRSPFADLNEDERMRHKGELVYPNFMLSLSADHVTAFSLWPRSPDETTVVCDFLFHPDEIAKPGFDPGDAVDFWDVVNRQDWSICENVQAGMQSRAFTHGYYAPMEDASLDIRRYIAAHLGEDAAAPSFGRDDC